MQEQAKETVGSPEQIEFVEVAATDDGTEPHRGNGIATVVTVAAVGIGAVALETALLPGVILGVAAMWLPHDVRQAFAPLARSTAHGVYRIGEKTKELIADVREEIEDIVAESTPKMPEHSWPRRLLSHRLLSHLLCHTPVTVPGRMMARAIVEGWGHVD